MAVDRLPLVLFAAELTFFHTSEFALAALYHRGTVTRRSWLFSWRYIITMAAAVAEYLVMAWLLPGRRVPRAVVWAGVVLAAAGEGVRKAAIVTAGRAFTHDLAPSRVRGHSLVTHGVYSLARHPGYLGWTLWAVTLGNALCALLFAVLALRFFAARVPVEERLLLQFFGRDFTAYAARVPTWMPGVP